MSQTFMSPLWLTWEINSFCEIVFDKNWQKIKDCRQKCFCLCACHNWFPAHWAISLRSWQTSCTQRPKLPTTSQSQPMATQTLLSCYITPRPQTSFIGWKLHDSPMASNLIFFFFPQSGCNSIFSFLWAGRLDPLQSSKKLLEFKIWSFL